MVEEQPGQRVGPYVLEAALARGGMGELWRARHEGMGGFRRPVALKRVRAGLLDGDHLQAFLREARVGARLVHPNVASVLDVGVEESNPYLVMELVEGVDLRRLAKRGRLRGVPLPPALAGYVMHQVLEALEAAHAMMTPEGRPAPVVHRDISPDNILVGRHGEVRLVDFGLARSTAMVDNLTQTGFVKGKLNYMAPEHLRGEALEPSWDIFSLGITFYELLTGQKPYSADNPLQALAAAVAPLPHPSDVANGVPVQLGAMALAWREPLARNRPTAAAARHRLELELESMLSGLPARKLGDYLATVVGDTETLTGATGAHPLACAKCGGTLLGEFVARDVIADRCVDCGGTWLDAHEVVRLLGGGLRHAVALHAGVPPGGAMDGVRGDCPRCRVHLSVVPVRQQQFHVEECPSCRGVWFDAGEMETLARGGDVGGALLQVAKG